MKLISLIVLLPWAYASAGLIPLPSTYGEIEPGVGRALTIGSTLDVPDKYLDVPSYPSSRNYLWFGLYNSPTCDRQPPLLTTNVRHTEWLYIQNQGAHATLGELVRDGSYHLSSNMTYLNWAPTGNTIYQLVSVTHEASASSSNLWTGPCTPVAVTTPASCALVEGHVLLDHGTVSTVGSSTASAMITVSCSSKGSGHLALPSGGDTISVGTGGSVISTDAGPLSTDRPFAKGNTPIELISTLNGVGVGGWEASSVLVLEMD